MDKLALSFFVIMNPFAQFLYLKPVIDDLDLRTFFKVYWKATLMSFSIYSLFVFFGETIFTGFFNISFEAFKVFGGIIIFSYAFQFIMKGTKGVLQIKEDLDDLASEIAIPFIVGAGTIYLSILIGHSAPSILSALGVIAGVMCLNYFFVIGFAIIKDQMKRKQKVAFDKHLSIAVRLNGFFMGAIGVHMILEGILIFFSSL